MKNNSSISLIATIIVAVAAVAVAVVAAVTLMNNNRENESDDRQSSSLSSESVFRPDQAFVDECTYAAHDLIRDSYQIIRLFVTEGLAHYDEPYGNEPEDGLYTVNSTDYTSLEQIEQFVRSVYVEGEAQRILHNIDENGMSVYQNRLVDPPAGETGSADETVSDAEQAPDKVTVLGIDADFVPKTDYKKDWSSVTIAVQPVSETECDLTVYLDGVTEETLNDENRDSVLEITMHKIDEEWRLSEFKY